MTAQELRAQADSLAAQALHGDLFSSPASEAKIQELRAQARALETETVSETVSEVESHDPLKTPRALIIDQVVSSFSFANVAKVEISEDDRFISELYILSGRIGFEYLDEGFSTHDKFEEILDHEFELAKVKPYHWQLVAVSGVHAVKMMWLKSMYPYSETEVETVSETETVSEVEALKAKIGENRTLANKLLEEMFELRDQIAAQDAVGKHGYRGERSYLLLHATLQDKQIAYKNASKKFDQMLETLKALLEIPSHDDDDLMAQWREANRAGEGQSFGDPDDLTCEIDIYDSAEIEGAQVLCGAGEGYLVRWMDDHYLVCDAHGWWACRVTL
jgi:hypothetical protein